MDTLIIPQIDHLVGWNYLDWSLDVIIFFKEQWQFNHLLNSNPKLKDFEFKT